MPKPKFQRADAFDPSKPTPAAKPDPVPYINAGAMNSAIYENGAASFPMSGFEDPVEKENEALKEQVAAVEEEKELWRQQAEALRQQLDAQSSGLIIQNGGLSIQGFQFSPTGLIPPSSPQVTHEAWKQVGKLLFRLEGSIQWLIGDWLAYGVDVKWGDIPKLAKELGKAEQTLHDYTSVARRVQFSFRKENLSYTHHVVAVNADLTTEQLEYALNYAAEHQLSVAAFRRWIDEQQGKIAVSNSILPHGASFKTMGAEIDKWMKLNPATAKDKDREAAHHAYEEIQAALHAFRQQWGIE